MSRSGGRPLFLVAVLLLAACGSRVDAAILEEIERDLMGSTPHVAVGATEPAGPDAPAPPDERPPPAHAEGNGEPEASEEAPAQAPVGAPDASGDEGASGDLLLELSVDPWCVAHGEVMTITIETEPRARLTKAIGYSDGQPHGQMGIRDVDDTGVYVWQWTITPEVPSGQAWAIVLAHDEFGERSANENIDFYVAGPDGGCG